MALGNHVIGGDAASVFAATSGIGATAGDLMMTISGLTVASAFVWCAYYLRRVLSSGLGKGDAAFIASGVLMSLTLLFLVLWVIGQAQKT